MSYYEQTRGGDKSDYVDLEFLRLDICCRLADALQIGLRYQKPDSK